MDKNRVVVIPTEPSQQNDGGSAPGSCKAEGRPSHFGLRKTLEEFSSRTTIPGLCHLSVNKSPLVKLCWLCLFFVGICMAIYQSRNLIDEYRRYAVLERSSWEIQWRVPFPSVTVCINQPIKWTTDPGQPGKTFVESVLKAIGEAAENKTLKSDYRFEEKILYKNLRKVDESEREKMGIPVKSFLISCTFGDNDCRKDVLHFNNLYYGNCFTFNPGFNQSNLLMASKSVSLNIMLRSDFDGAFPYMERDQGLILLIHPPGSAPVLDDRRIYNLYQGRWLRLGAAMSEFNRLKEPYMSKCMDTKERDFRSLYYTSERPYIYTVEACSESCMQNLTIDLCNCVVPYLPVHKQFPNNVCNKQATCDAMDESDAGALCRCGKPCKARSYALRADVDDRWLSQSVWVEWVKDVMSNYSDDSSQPINMSLASGFEVYMATTMFETMWEEPKIPWADFLGSLGGNLGLWVGISIISMVELLELMTSLVVLAARNISRIPR